MKLSDRLCVAVGVALLLAGGLGFWVCKNHALAEVLITPDVTTIPAPYLDGMDPEQRRELVKWLPYLRKGKNFERVPDAALLGFRWLRDNNPGWESDQGVPSDYVSSSIDRKLAATWWASASSSCLGLFLTTFGLTSLRRARDGAPR